MDVFYRLKFSFSLNFYKKQAGFDDFPENKLTETIHFKKNDKICLFSVFTKLGVSLSL